MLHILVINIESFLDRFRRCVLSLLLLLFLTFLFKKRSLLVAAFTDGACHHRTGLHTKYFCLYERLWKPVQSEVLGKHP